MQTFLFHTLVVCCAGRKLPGGSEGSEGSSFECSHGEPPVQVKEQKREWQQLYDEMVQSSTKAGLQPPSQEDFFWAMSCVRSRTFSGPYIGSTLQDRIRTAGLVAVLAVGNTALGLADPEKTLSAAIAVLLFNVLYELILSRSLKQYAICPLIDLFNHSSAVQVKLPHVHARLFVVLAGQGWTKKGLH